MLGRQCRERGMSAFVSLLAALEGSFDKPLSDLPDELRQRIKQDFSPMPWDDLTPDQRRAVAQQRDWQHDPAMEKEQEYWFEFECRKDALQEKQALLQAFNATTPIEAAEKKTQLDNIEKQLAKMEIQAKQAERMYAKKLSAEGNSPAPANDQTYIPYPKAYKVLSERLYATADELAAWVWLGPEEHGLVAYVSANEISPPPRFYYSLGAEDDFDYISPLMSCWFSESDTLNFQPADRYITGAELIDRWSTQPGVQAESFVRAKIAESRLIDIHPLYGATQGSFPDEEIYPPIENGLFSLASVESIEAEDFLATIATPRGETPAQRKKRLQRWLQDEEKLKGKSGAQKRTADREGISRQTLSAILKRKG